MRSETPQADALQDEMVEVLLAVMRHGAAAAAGAAPPLPPEVGKALSSLQRQVTELMRRVPAQEEEKDTGLLATRAAQDIARLRALRGDKADPQARGKPCPRQVRWEADRAAAQKALSPAEASEVAQLRAALAHREEELRLLRAGLAEDAETVTTAQAWALHGGPCTVEGLRQRLRKEGYVPVGTGGRRRLRWRLADVLALRNKDLLR